MSILEDYVSEPEPATFEEWKALVAKYKGKVDLESLEMILLSHPEWRDDA
jgi:hypothetical protein